MVQPAMVPDWSHRTVLAAEPKSASMARDFVCVHLVAHALSHLVEDIRLVASELATNALAHARTPFTVTLSLVNGSVLLAIKDESAAGPMKAMPDVMDMNGRGLMLVELLSSEWGSTFDDAGCKSVWASFTASPT